jgi:ribonuclease P/MRP protein subunit POP8
MEIQSLAPSLQSPINIDMDSITTPFSGSKQKQEHTNHLKGHEIASRFIKTPAFSYACLHFLSDSTCQTDPDAITVRSHLSSALTQFLGLSGAAIPVDILKLEGGECWVRVAREDLGTFVAAVGGWAGANESGERLGWRVKTSGNWLNVLVAGRKTEIIWDG